MKNKIKGDNFERFWLNWNKSGYYYRSGGCTAFASKDKNKNVMANNLNLDK